MAKSSLLIKYDSPTLKSHTARARSWCECVVCIINQQHISSLTVFSTFPVEISARQRGANKKRDDKSQDPNNLRLRHVAVMGGNYEFNKHIILRMSQQRDNIFASHSKWAETGAGQMNLCRLIWLANADASWQLVFAANSEKFIKLPTGA